jgi:hypothetical protein
MSDLGTFNLITGNAEETALCVSLMNAIQAAVGPLIVADEDQMPKMIALASAAAARWAGAQYGIGCFAGLAKPDGRDLKLAMQGAARNFKVGVADGLDLCTRAAKKQGAMGNVQ